MEMKKIASIVKGMTVAGLLAFTNNSFAVTADGSLGTTSTGTVDITVDVGEYYQISQLDPMTGTYTPGSDVALNDGACVYTNNGTGLYDVEVQSARSLAIGAGAGTDFFLSDGASDVVYNVEFDDGVVATPVDLDHSAVVGTNAVNFSGANQTVADCSSGVGGNVTILVDVPELGAGTLNGLGEVTSGNYTDELTIIISAQ